MLHLPERSGPALIEASSGAVIDYGRLREMAQDATAPLGSSKRLLLLFCDISVPTAAIYAGALLRGHAVALMDAQIRPHLRANLVRSYRVPWVAGPPGLADSLRAEGIAIGPVHDAAGHEIVRTAYPEDLPLHPDLAVLLGTSGTTGSTKLVRLSRRNVESNAASIVEYLGLGPEERPISALPFQYAFGLSVLNSHWLAGAALVLTPAPMVQPPFWDVFRAHRCTSIAGVPFTYQMLERIGFRDLELPSLRTMQQAGGALDRRLAEIYGRFMKERGGRFFVMYGQTEATARISYVPPDMLQAKLGSAGIAIPGGRIRIENPSGEEPAAGPAPPPGVDGEVIYEGPNVMLGYATRPEDLAAADTQGGVLRTGDLGHLDTDGYLFLVGRSSRIAKVFGVRINLDEVEVRLREHGPAAVVAAPDLICAFCSFGDDASLNEIRMTMAREFNINHNALVFRRVESLPAHASGKIDYARVQSWI
jgi:acyl-CoA synthetase (AMP-forming)/AMP-acid ligase II